MQLPLVAIVGRPNVGKSSLVNRIAQTNDAIVHEMRGVTRDRSYHKADWNGVEFMLVDTGGIEVSNDDSFQASIRNQAIEATNQADVIILLTDGKVGLQTDDDEVARLLRRSNKPIILAVNKIDNPEKDDDIWPFYSLGFNEVWPISATHGHGTGDLLDEVVNQIHQVVDLNSDEDEDNDEINVAIIGRPNAGKSSLTNKLTKSNRSIVSSEAGTTRDAIDTVVTHDDKTYRIVDTAGLRRKSQIDESVEYFGFVRAMRAIDRADVALLVIDATLGVTNEDQRVANYASERGCALAIIVNKWDLIEDAEKKAAIRENISDDLQFISYAPVVAISALTGKSVDRVWKTIDECFASYTRVVSTSSLNNWLSEIHEDGHSVTKGKSVLRIKYVTQTGIKPPMFTFFCNRPDIVTDNYERFLVNRIRKSFDFTGTPIRFRFKKKD